MRKKEEITIKDFLKMPAGYFFYKKSDIEIALEPCLNGYDVAVYRNLELLEPKRCTDIKNANDPIELVGMTKKVSEWINEYARKYLTLKSK